MSKIYDHDIYFNENIRYLFNSSFVEYDLKEAGFNIIKEFSLLSDEEIDKLSSMTKNERKIYIGKLQIKNETLKDGLKKGFREARKRFIEFYNIKDEEIISIKKDALFITKELSPKCKVGEYLVFREKNEYTSYIRFTHKLEVYFNPIKIDVKGINVDNLEEHKDYMLSFLSEYITKMETDSSNHVLGYLKRFSDKYKTLQLPIGYYREFNNRSLYNTSDGYFNDTYDISDKDLNIDFNMYHIIIPLIKITLNI